MEKLGMPGVVSLYGPTVQGDKRLLVSAMILVVAAWTDSDMGKMGAYAG